MPRLAALIRLDRGPVEMNELEPLLASLSETVESTPPVVRAGNHWAAAAWRGSSLRAPKGGKESAPENPLLLLDGRIDNRHDLAAALNLPASPTDDAELLALGFAAWGDELFSRLVGPFALLVTDPVRGWLQLVRDPLGDRTLYFRQSGNRLAIASRPSALLAIRGSSLVPDEGSIARYLAAGGPRPGATFFSGIEEVPPGGLIRFDGGARAQRVAGALRAERFPVSWRRGDYEQRFRDLLDEAVSCRLDPAGSNAILMSGGLDSTAVAATAARDLTQRGAAPPCTISWVFRELPNIDESRWIDAANRATGAQPLPVVGDDLWPLSDESHWPRPLDAPVLGPFWRLHARSLALARDAGSTSLLSGESGDQLWLGGRDWLRDWVRSGRLGAAAVGLARATWFEMGGAMIRPTLRHSVARLLRQRPLPLSVVRPWLTDWARARIEAEEPTTPALAPNVAEERAAELLAPFDLLHMRAAERDAQPFGIELRRPFRDRRVVEFFLGLPARWLFWPGAGKPLLRHALVDRLPPEVLRRRVATSLLALADRGIADRSWPTIRAALERKDAIWPRYVRREWLWGRAVDSLARRRDNVERLVIWNCFCLERWRDAIEGTLASEGSTG